MKTSRYTDSQIIATLKQAEVGKLCIVIKAIADGLEKFSTDKDTLGDAYEYLVGQFAAIRRVCIGKTGYRGNRRLLCGIWYVDRIDERDSN